MRIGIVSLENPRSDRKAISGILFKLTQSIERANLETIWIKVREPYTYKLLTFLGKVVHKLTSRTIYWDRTFIGTRLLSKLIDYNEIDKCDYIIFVYNYWILHRMDIKVPIIYTSDCTYDLARGYYLKRMFKWNEQQAESIEINALNKAQYHISSSNWRHSSLIDHYNISQSRCSVLEYGPCMEIEKYHKPLEIDGTLHLLFMGVDWERKGGDIAVEVCNILNSRGVKCVLHVLGIKKMPKTCINNQNINFIGFLNKNIQEEYEKLNSILVSSHMLILPTKAECSPIVFCENAAYGNPIITYNTGGIGNYVYDGVNGYKLPLAAKAVNFADKIFSIISENELVKLSQGSIKIYEEKLNWNNWSVWFKANIK